MHPFIRLAKSYQQLFKFDGKHVDEELLKTQSKIAHYIQKISQRLGQENPEFEGFAKIPSFAVSFVTICN